MKPNTTNPYLYTGDWYGYTVKSGAQGIVYNEYTLVPQQVAMSLSVSLIGELLIESPTKMQKNSYIRNIVDSNNEEIYTGGEWQIIQTAPLLGPMGLKAGYKYRAQLIAGDI